MRRNIEISTTEYNFIMNEWAACERALQSIMDERGVNVLRLGNVEVYRLDDNGVGTRWIDEDGNRAENVDYVLAYGL